MNTKKIDLQPLPNKKPFVNQSFLAATIITFSFNVGTTKAAMFTEDDSLLPGVLDKDSSIINEDFYKGLPLSSKPLKEALDLYQQGLSHFQKGEKEEGITLLKRAWEKDKNFSIAGETLAMTYLRENDFTNALKIAQKLQNESPNRHQGYVFAGYAYEGLKKPEDSKKSFLKALEIQPGAPDASWKLAMDALKIGNTDQARKLYEDVLHHNPDHLRTLLSLSELEFNAGNIKRTEELLTETIQKHPKVIQPRLMLTRLYLKNNDFKKALAVSDSTLKVFNNNVEALDLLGIIQRNSGNLAVAISTFQSAIQAEPKTTTPRYNLALTYLQSNQNEAASKELDLIFKIDANHFPSKILQTSLLLDEKQWDKAQAMLQMLAKDYPNQPEIAELNGKFAMSQNRPDEAVSHFQIALKDRQTSNLVMQLASAQILTKNSNTGLTTLKTWLSKHPEDDSARNRLAAYSMMLGKTEEATSQYREIIGLHPSQFDAHNNLALLLAQQGNLDKALEHAKNAQRLAPENTGVLDTLGVILCRKGNFKEGIDLLQKAAIKQPEDANIHYHLAEALIETKNITDAKQILNNLLKQNINAALREQVEKTLQKLTLQ